MDPLAKSTILSSPYLPGKLESAAPAPPLEKPASAAASHEKKPPVEAADEFEVAPSNPFSQSLGAHTQGAPSAAAPFDEGEPGAQPISMAQFALEASQPQGRQKLPRSVKKEWEAPPPEEGKVRPRFNRDLTLPEPPNLTTGHKRGGFSAAQSKEIIGREHPGSIHGAQARSIETIAAAGQDPMGTQRMGMSLNHILSDSRIKDLYLQAVKNYEGDPAQDEAMKGFFHSLSGGDPARVDAAMADWNTLKGQPKTNAAKVHRAAEAISNTPTNVRPGPARPNTAISSAFDPEIWRQGPFGVETAETENIRIATLRLADAGLADRDSAFNAVTPARSRHDPNLRASSTANPRNPEMPGFLFERPSSPISTGTKRAHDDDGWNSAPESYAQENAGLEQPRKKPRR